MISSVNRNKTFFSREEMKAHEEQFKNSNNLASSPVTNNPIEDKFYEKLEKEVDNTNAQRLGILFTGMSAQSIEIVRASSLFKICEKSMNVQ